VNGKDIVELRTTSRQFQAAVRPNLIGRHAGSHQTGLAFDLEKEGIPKPTGQPYRAELLVGQQTVRNCERNWLKSAVVLALSITATSGDRSSLNRLMRCRMRRSRRSPVSLAWLRRTGLADPGSGGVCVVMDGVLEG
jgi:hypothetical protein